MSVVLRKLARSIERAGAPLSVGLEPSPAYVHPIFGEGIKGLEQFLLCIIEATHDLAAAVKPNVAFFESLGSRGWAMLERVRANVPDEMFVIIDAKRGDIGTTAEHYARAVFGNLGADAVTVNPLMGADSVEPFLSWGDRLTYLLCLTSNLGAGDFLERDDLAMRIAERAVRWDQGRGRLGLVVGATKDGQRVRQIRSIAPELPMLIPGIGAQGGSMDVAWQGARPGAGLGDCGVLMHVSRSILPMPKEPIHSEMQFVEMVRKRAMALRGVMSEAMSKEGSPA
ncbi:MAG: orotidine-5'-phosphate decarboxylase [Phycisphaerales bacterium]|nr:orotidine-5'-phosphate decarboxylase [Phycisphaerales bacterium]